MDPQRVGFQADLAAALLAILFAWLLLPLFAFLFRGLLPAGLHLGIGPMDAALVVVVGVSGSFLFCLPVSLRLAAVQPLYLLQQTAEAPPARLLRDAVLRVAERVTPFKRAIAAQLAGQH